MNIYTYITQLMILYLIMRCCYQLLNIASGYLQDRTDVFVLFIIPVMFCAALLDFIFCEQWPYMHRLRILTSKELHEPICSTFHSIISIWVHAQTTGVWKLKYKGLKTGKFFSSMFQLIIQKEA